MGGVPDALWVRHSCVPVGVMANAWVAMDYKSSPVRPVCSIDTETFYYIPPGGFGLPPPDPTPDALALDLGDVLARFLVEVA